MVRYRDILSCTQSMKSIVKMLFTLYNIKTKIHLPQPMVAIADFLYPFYTFLFSCSQRFLNYVAFKCFGFEHTWWMVLNIPDEWFWTYLMNGFERTWWMVLNVPDEWFFQKHVGHTKLDIYVFISLLTHSWFRFKICSL